MNRIVNVLGAVAVLAVFGVVLAPEPILAMSGRGTAEDPYMVCNETDLADVNNNLTAYYKLANDIYAEGFFAPIGDGGHYTDIRYPINDISTYPDWVVYPETTPRRLWDKVDDDPSHDGDSSYIEATQDGAEALFPILSLDVPISATSVVVYVGVTCRKVNSSSASVQRILRVNGADYFVGDAFEPSTSYPGGHAYSVVSKNPATGLPWTPAEVNQISIFGIRVHDNTAPVRVTNLYIKAYYYNAFSGVFDGNGHTVWGFDIHKPTQDHIGFFGCTDGALIKDLNIVDFNVTGDDYVGGLIGEAVNTTVENVVAYNGTIVGDGYQAGGLIGYNYEALSLSNGLFAGSVRGSDEMGGLVGCTYSNVNITGCAVWGAIGCGSGPCYADSIGGLVGENRAALRMYRSYARCSVHGAYYAGGLVGISGWGGTLNISECFATGNVTAEEWGAGGLVGDTGDEGDLILNCYARGSVSGDEAVGGAFGSFYNGSFGYIYSTGLVTGNRYVGGLHGYDGGTEEIYPCFWDKQTSNQTRSISGTGETTALMKMEETYTDLCHPWDFETIWAIDPEVNDGYPYLTWRDPVQCLYQAVWFQPNGIIRGTTLRNRTGEADGEIHWGSNPEGIEITLSPFVFVSDYNYTVEDTLPPPLDVVGPTGNPGYTSDTGTLETNPLYRFVKSYSDLTGIPVTTLWVIFASVIVVMAMVLTYRYLPHQIIVALVGGGLSAFFYVMDIYPFWVILVFVVWAVAIILGERSPTV